MARTLAAVLVVLLCAAHAAAEESPWARGVPPARQTRATELYSQGNALFVESKYAEAVEKYRPALEAWDHPGIHYNMAAALINLEKPLEAYEHLKAALRYGDAPFSKQEYQQAQTYEKLLTGRLAVLQVNCPDSGAKVMLDGEELLVGPGAITKVAMPGSHQVGASKPGYLADTRSLLLIPGQKNELTIHLKTIQEATVMKRRWKTYVPWTVLGAGVLVAAVGVVLQLQARSDASQYNSIIDQQCPQGCATSDISEFQSIKSRAQAENIAAFALYGVGGALALSGITLAILNIPRPVVESSPKGPTVQVAPTFASTGAGATLRLAF
jgi:tetratricopeptide (TPR) repeat protein